MHQQKLYVVCSAIRSPQVILEAALHFSPREFSPSTPEREEAFYLSGKAPHIQEAGAAGQVLRAVMCL